MVEGPDVGPMSNLLAGFAKVLRVASHPKPASNCWMELTPSTPRRPQRPRSPLRRRERSPSKKRPSILREPRGRNRKNAPAQFLSTLEQYAFPKIGRLSIADVDVGMVLKVLEPIWHDKTETADRVRQRIKSVLDWGTVRGLRKGDNPAQWQGFLDKLLPPRTKIKQVKHHAALPYAELPAFVTELQPAREWRLAR